MPQQRTIVTSNNSITTYVGKIYCSEMLRNLTFNNVRVLSYNHHVRISFDRRRKESPSLVNASSTFTGTMSVSIARSPQLAIESFPLDNGCNNRSFTKPCTLQLSKAFSSFIWIHRCLYFLMPLYRCKFTVIWLKFESVEFERIVRTQNRK
jgi:hypothetical protein